MKILAFSDSKIGHDRFWYNIFVNVFVYVEKLKNIINTDIISNLILC